MNTQVAIELLDITNKIEATLAPESTANAVVIFSAQKQGKTTTRMGEELVEILRHLRLGRKPLGIIFHLFESQSARIEVLGNISEDEKKLLDDRVVRFNRLLNSGEYDDDFDEFDSEEEEERFEFIGHLPIVDDIRDDLQ